MKALNPNHLPYGRTNIKYCLPCGKVKVELMTTAIRQVMRETGLTISAAQQRLKRYALDHAKLYEAKHANRKGSQKWPLLTGLCAELDVRKRELEAKK